MRLLQRWLSHLLGSVHTGSPSAQVQSYVCTLSAAELVRLCQVYRINSDLFNSIRPLYGQFAFDPPLGYEAVYVE